MAGNVMKLTGVTFTGTGLPYLERDATATSGTLFLFDLANSASYAPPGNEPATGQVITDLSRAGRNFTLTEGADPVTYDGKGLLFPDKSTAVPTAYLSTPDIPSLRTGRTLLVLWGRGRVSATNPGTNDFQGLAGQNQVPNAYNVNNSWMIWMNSGTSGTGPFTFVYQAAGTSGAPASWGATAGQPKLTDGQLFQFGIAVEFISGSMKLTSFRDGAQVASTTIAGVASLQVGSHPFTVAAQSPVAGNSKGRIYRAFAQDLAVSGRTALETIQLDYAKNLARFQ